MTDVLRVEHLSVSVEDTERSGLILSDVSFEVKTGECLGIVGESGSGKTILALAVMGLLPPALRIEAGKIVLLGEDLTGGSPEKWRAHRGRDIAMVFQEPMTSLNPVMTVGAQIREVLIKRRGMSRKEAGASAIDLLAKVEIASPQRRYDTYPHELSGGMRQRVVVAMALAAKATLLIADEPTTALDVTVQAQVLELLRRLRDESNLSMTLITHDLGVIAELADRVMVLYAGTVAEVAPVDDFFDHPEHPYSRALLASTPTMSAAAGRLVAIPGGVPGPFDSFSGCRFAARCPVRIGVCESVRPPAVTVALRHHARCHLMIADTEEGAGA
jgi:oligopeptide/dipeptide ABC transporter ATP-binding protein